MVIGLDDMIESYRKTILSLQEAYEKCENGSDRSRIQSMITSCEAIVECLLTGSYPSRARPINRLSRWQRTVFVPPDKLNIFIDHNAIKCESSLTAEDRRRIDEALNLLTRREQEIFVTVYGFGLSISEAAAIHGISKSSVSTYIKRAKTKLAAKLA